MADTGRTISTSVNRYEPSLWYLMGQDTVRSTLIALVDQVHNDLMAGNQPEYPIVLLVGDYGWGRRMIAKALHNALGNLEFREAALILGLSEDPTEFFEQSSEYTSFYIPQFNRVSDMVGGQLIHIIRDGCFQKSFPGMPNEKIDVQNRLIILSISRNDPICPEFSKFIGLRCDLTPYTPEQIFRILKQRIEYLHWKTTDTTLSLIAVNAKNNPGIAVKMLQSCYMLSRAENKDQIELIHAHRAVALKK